jgi:tRNA pseudouridine13 synthase
VKLKRLPEDFQVEELTQLSPTGGAYALYRLAKRGIGTPEVIDAILRRWHIPRHRVSYGGLKDKHALTRQYLTVQSGMSRGLKDAQFELVYLGQVDRAFTPKEITGNRFCIVLRDLSEGAVTRAVDALPAVRRDGLPNYFDDQRFGSLGQSNEFIGASWCKGDYERALWLALADPHEDDRADEREQKRLLREHWGDFRACKQALARSNRRSIVTYLADKPPDRPDYRGAFARLNVDMRGLYLSAFQSFLWNRMLARTIESCVPAEKIVPVPLRMGPVPFFRELEAGQREALLATELPLPSSRLHLSEGPTLDLIKATLADTGLELRQLRVKYPRDSFFSKGFRTGLAPVSDLDHAVAADELYDGRRRLTLRFSLPRGSYATILVKRLTEC